jgi:hypothetical protein
MDEMEIVSLLIQAHTKGNANDGVEVRELKVGNTKELGVLLKEWVILLAARR